MRFDLQVISLTLIRASATNLKILVKHTKPPIKKIPFNAIFRLVLICRLQIIGMGSARMMRSPTKDKTPFVVPMRIRALGMQCPGWALFQKKETGVHCRMLEVKAAIAQHWRVLAYEYRMGLFVDIRTLASTRRCQKFVAQCWLLMYDFLENIQSLTASLLSRMSQGLRNILNSMEVLFVNIS